MICMKGLNRESFRSDLESDNAAKVNSRLQYLPIVVYPLLIRLRKLEVILVGNGQAKRCLPNARKGAGGLLRMCGSEKGLLRKCSSETRYVVAVGGGKGSRDRHWRQIWHNSTKCCTLQACRYWMLASQHIVRRDRTRRSPYTLVEAISVELERMNSRAAFGSPDMSF